MKYLVTADEMRQIEHTTEQVYGISTNTLMELAGRAVAEHCQKLIPNTGVVTFLCGTGNNGGDGFVAARTLLNWGYDVCVYLLGDRKELKNYSLSSFVILEKLKLKNLHEWSTIELESLIGDLKKSSLVIDAILGTGIQGPAREPVATVIGICNDLKVHGVSVDIPSGICSDTGQRLGTAFQAQSTVTFGFAKRGHYLYPGRDYTGHLEVADIGLPALNRLQTKLSAQLLSRDMGEKIAIKRPENCHKGSFGHIGVIAGSPGYPGSAVLTLNGALRSGAGKVSWFVNNTTLQRAVELKPEVMLIDLEEYMEQKTAAIQNKNITALTLGPGLGHDRTVYEMMKTILTNFHLPMCLDADALHLLALYPELWSIIDAPIVITPHAKEMARLCDTTVADVLANRVDVAVRVAINRCCVVVFKGADTIIASEHKEVVISAIGSPALATAGTGDVLAGLIGGLLAQNYNSFQAATLGVLAHACAGELAEKRLGQFGTVASDVSDCLGQVWQSWQR